MKLETFYAEFFRRIGVDRSAANAEMMDYAEQCAQTIDAMTGGAFYKSVEKLPDDYQFPTEADNAETL